MKKDAMKRVLLVTAGLLLLTGVGLVIWRPAPSTSLQESPESAEARSALPEPAAAEGEPVPVEPATTTGAPRVPLDRLLRPSVADPKPDPLRGAPQGPVAGPQPQPGSLAGAVDVDQRSSVSHRGTQVDETDVTVAVPVGESVKIRGGVRREERDTGNEPQAETKPAVGVEVKY